MKNNIKTIYLHIGLHKTGSTSIQKTLYTHRKTLIQHNYYYPKTWATNHNVHLMSLCLDNPEMYPVNRKEKRTSGEEIYLFNQESIRSLNEELAESFVNNLIFSAEDISLLSNNNLIRLKSFLEEVAPQAKTKVIISYRELTKILASDYQQKVKSGNSIERLFLQKHNISYQNRTQKFIDVFGRENVIGYAFEDAIKHPEGIIGKFCEIIGLPSNIIPKKATTNKNQGISDKAVDIISYVNHQVPLFDSDGNVVKNRFRRDTFLLHQIKGDKFKLSPEMVNYYLEENHQDLIWLKDEFGIDYLSQKMHNKRQPTHYGEQYQQDIQRFYPFLPPLVQKHVKEYIHKISKEVTNQENVATLFVLNEWLQKKNTFLNHLLPLKLYQWAYQLIRKIKHI